MICKNCLKKELSKGIRKFKCRLCQEHSANYIDGIDMCLRCSEKMLMCAICGRSINNPQKEELL